MDASDAVFPVLSKAKPFRGSRRKVIGVKHYRFPIFEYNVSRIWNWIVWLLVASPDRSLLLGLVANVIVFIIIALLLPTAFISSFLGLAALFGGTRLSFPLFRGRFSELLVLLIIISTNKSPRPPGFAFQSSNSLFYPN
jgi:hypothetical protein